MKCWIVSIIAVLGSLHAIAQQDYFLYIQTDNKQAFYVRLNNKIYSSTESGYLILSKLTDSTRELTVGFPKNSFPEQVFSLPQSRKDAGYLLKNFGDKGWGLFNLQTLAVIMNSNNREEKKSPDITGVKKSDAFSVLLANAVNDTAILYNTVYRTKAEPGEPIIAKKEKGVDPATKSNATDSTIIAKKYIQPVKDSILSPDKGISKTDSTSIAKKQTPVLPKDSSVVVKKYIQPVKDSILAPGNKPVADSIAIAKKPVVHDSTALAATVDKKPIQKDSSAVTKIIFQPVKDTILSTGTKKDMKDSAVVAVNHPDIQHDSTALTDQNKETKKTAPIAIDTKSRADSGGALKNNEPLFRPLKAPVTKAAEALTDTSYIAVYVDESKDKFDTIRISIPFNETSLAKKITADTSIVVKITEITPVKPAADSTTHYESAKKEAVIENKSETTTPVVKDSVATAKKPVMVNSDCKAEAWDSDIDKLRIKMLAVKTDEEKITLAKKLFKEKCFSVKQVKALSELFTSDESKYKWFDAVYPFTSDAGNFGSLAELIKEEYYLNRFKAMLRN